MNKVSRKEAVHTPIILATIVIGCAFAHLVFAQPESLAQAETPAVAESDHQTTNQAGDLTPTKQDSSEKAGAQVNPQSTDENAPPFPTLTVEDLINLALEHNFDLKIKVREANSAFFEYLRIKGEAGLSLDIVGSLRRSLPVAKFRFDPTGPETSFQKEVSSSASLRLSYPLTPTGNLGYGEKAAEAGYLAIQAQVDSVTANAIANTFEAYSRYLTAEEAVAVAEEGLALAEEQLRHAKLRYDEGISPRLEVVQGEVAVSQAREELIKAQNSLTLAKNALFLTVGIDPRDYFGTREVSIQFEDWLDTLAEQISTVILPGLDEDWLHKTFVESTPDYRTIRSNELSLEYQIKGRKRGPFFNLSASYTRQTGSSFLKKGTWQYGLEGSWNLFDSGKTENLRRSLEEQREKVEIQLERYKQSFRLSIQEALSEIQSAVLGWQTAKNTLAQTEEALRMARLGYEEGVVTYLDLLSARSAYLGAKTREFAGRLSVITSYQKLLVKLGVTDTSIYIPKDEQHLLWLVGKGREDKNA